MDAQPIKQSIIRIIKIIIMLIVHKGLYNTVIEDKKYGIIQLISLYHHQLIRSILYMAYINITITIIIHLIITNQHMDVVNAVSKKKIRK